MAGLVGVDGDAAAGDLRAEIGLWVSVLTTMPLTEAESHIFTRGMSTFVVAPSEIDAVTLFSK